MHAASSFCTTVQRFPDFVGTLRACPLYRVGSDRKAASWPTAHGREYARSCRRPHRNTVARPCRDPPLRRHYAASGKRSGVRLGTLIAERPGRAILTHHHANGTLHTYIALYKPKSWVAAIGFSRPADARESIAWEFAGWAAQLVARVTASDTAPVVRPIHGLPVDHGWQSAAGVTQTMARDCWTSPQADLYRHREGIGHKKR